jgi:hypothetical protein
MVVLGSLMLLLLVAGFSSACDIDPTYKENLKSTLSSKADAKMLALADATGNYRVPPGLSVELTKEMERLGTSTIDLKYYTVWGLFTMVDASPAALAEFNKYPEYFEIRHPNWVYRLRYVDSLRNSLHYQQIQLKTGDVQQQFAYALSSADAVRSLRDRIICIKSLKALWEKNYPGWSCKGKPDGFIISGYSLGWDGTAPRSGTWQYFTATSSCAPVDDNAKALDALLSDPAPELAKVAVYTR